MADALRPLAWATIYSHPGREDMVEIGDANPVRERDAEAWGWQHRRVPLVEIPADQVLVSRELLERVCVDRSLLPGHNMAINAIDELRALLSEQDGGKP
ncbi:hypothetical protein RVS53_000410 [Pseudomonas aeruginosa]|nr:hypothetical protein [Pseudomonas aeruginosa]